jgi:serine/threonine protein kinase
LELAPGAVIGGRYQVQRRAWDAGRGAVWLAFDSVLERAVLIQTFPDVDPAELASSVARAARISHPGLSQIYDMTAEPPGIVFENAPGGRLADRKDGAMSPAHAAALCARLAAAIGAMHEHDSTHGAIEPRTVLLDEEGRPKLCAALPHHAGNGEPAYRPADPDASAEERDRYALGAIAYRLFTGRDPGPDAPPARTARRGVPPQVDALLSRALGRDAAPRPSLAEFRRILEPLASEELPERGPGFFRQESSWLVPVLVIIAIGIAAIAFGVQKAVQGPKSQQTQSPSASATPFKVESVDDFDPQGDGKEHGEEVANVIDGTDKAWSTFDYANPLPDGRKKGVGLLFDLGIEQTVGRIEVRTPGTGWTAEWRVADVRETRAEDYRIVQPFMANGDPVVLGTPVRARFWLLWITHLVDSGNGPPHPYRAQVSEVSFFPR